jgi:hypothetical protein
MSKAKVHFNLDIFGFEGNREAWLNFSLYPKIQIECL